MAGEALVEALNVSPHTWGCSGCAKAVGACVGVFPAYAGMFLCPAGQGRWGSGFPRIRGDVPCAQFIAGAAERFSPHTRGCSDSTTLSITVAEVFPAYAGIFQKQDLQ